MQFDSLILDIFPGEWVQGALALALFSVFVVIGVFSYLNHYTHRTYFSLWTVAWLFYAFYLAACFQLQEHPSNSLLVMVRCSCIGISAMFMFWGSFHLTGRGRHSRELVLGIGLMILWNYIAAYKVREPLWITVPVFALLAGASLYTCALYRKQREASRTNAILETGFLLWSLYLLGFPFLARIPGPMVLGYLVSAVLAFYITLGMIVQVLQEERERHDNLLGELNQGKARRRLLEQEVAVSEEKYRALFDSASDAIFLVDLETLEICEANQSAHRFVQYNPGELLGRNFQDLCPSLRQDGTALLDNKKMFDAVFHRSSEFAIVRGNGTRVECEGDANLVPCRGRPVLQINLREITQRKQMEQQLRRAEKLSAIGQLVAGVAHELNNPLAVIMGYSQILTQQKDLADKTRTDVRKIFHESERAAKIVRNLLTFARPCEPNMLVVDVNRLVMSVLEIREAELRAAGIELKIELASQLPKTKADPNQIEQVLTNLVTNAAQAMVNHSEERILRLVTERSGPHLCITISDTGPGIPAESLPRIFEPFYTTKAPGKGTGLGLPISHSIMEAHRGRIWVESQVGQGSRFCLQLPLVVCDGEPPAETVMTPSRQDAKPACNDHRLLIVDDEPGIAEVLQAILSGNGYTVDTATNGAVAIERIAAHDYSLIISDMKMPEMDGETLYRTLKKQSPELARRLIFLTGDTVSTDTRAFLESTGNRWFSKPFNIGEIEEVVANLLGQDRPAAPPDARHALRS